MKRPLRSLLCFSGLFALIGCGDDANYVGVFSAPSVVAVATPGNEGLFSEPVGFVANRHGGQISLLALKQGRFLTDDPASSFIRGNPLATGRSRITTSLATRIDNETLTVYAGDQRFQTLMEVPYIVGRDESGFHNEPIEQELTVSEVTFVDADRSGDSAELADLEVKAGFTSTESWTIEFGSGKWWVTGSRSGRLESPAVSGEPYAAEQRVVSFTINGSGTEGDRFEFSTDSGLVEYEVGGTPIEVAMAPAQDILAAIVQPNSADNPSLIWWDPASKEQQTIDLPADSAPSRMGWSEDGQTLYVADRSRSAVWSVQKGNTTATEHVLPWPILDVAALDAGTTPQLFIVPTTGRSVWRYNLATETLTDSNLETTEVDGLPMQSNVRGITAIPLAFPFPEVNNDGGRGSGRAVAVSLYSGVVQFVDEQTGCLVQDESGPRTSANSEFGGTFDYGTNFETVWGPFLQVNGLGSRHVSVNQCAGVALSEFWTVTFDENQQGWEVEGSISGVLPDLAYEDTRYVSPNGAISFVVRSGASISRDGYTFRFTVDHGALQANGDNNRDGQIDEEEVNLVLPTDPVYFQYRVGPRDGGWQTLDERPLLLVASEGANFATRIEPPTGKLEVIWE
jgi:hypothetical protein